MIPWGAIITQFVSICLGRVTRHLFNISYLVSLFWSIFLPPPQMLLRLRYLSLSFLNFLISKLKLFFKLFLISKISTKMFSFQNKYAIIPCWLMWNATRCLLVATTDCKGSWSKRVLIFQEKNTISVVTSNMAVIVMQITRMTVSSFREEMRNGRRWWTHARAHNPTLRGRIWNKEDDVKKIPVDGNISNLSQIM